MKRQSWRIIPNTTLGKWSVVLVVVMPILFIIGTTWVASLYESVLAGGTLWADFVARPALMLTMLAGVAAGICAFITGLLAVIRKKEKALLVYLSTLIGALLIYFLVGMIISPN